MFGLSPCTLKTENVLRQWLIDVVGTTVGLVSGDRCTLDTMSALGKYVAFVAEALGFAALGFAAGIVETAASLLLVVIVGNSLEDLKVVVELDARGQRVSDPLPPESLPSEDGFAPKKIVERIASHLCLHFF